jgi:hypothetical protein
MQRFNAKATLGSDLNRGFMTLLKLRRAQYSLVKQRIPADSAILEIPENCVIVAVFGTLQSADQQNRNELIQTFEKGDSAA